MAPSRRSEMLRALRGLSVENAASIVKSSLNAVNDPAAAASSVWTRAHFGAPSETMGSFSLPSSSAVELQTGCLVGVHQHMEVQQSSFFNSEVLPFDEFDPIQPQGSTDIDAANLHVTPHQFGYQSLGISSDFNFQPYRSPASALSRDTTGMNAKWDRVTDAPTSATHALGPGLLGQGAEIDMQLPELEALADADEVGMLQELLTHEQRRNMESSVDYLSPHQQHPNHSGEPIQMVDYYDPPGSDSQPSLPLPLRGMINYSTNHLTSLPYGHHQQCLQPPLSDLDQLVRSATFNSFPSSEPCAIEYPPSNSNIDMITSIVDPDIVQAAPTANMIAQGYVVEDPPSTFDMMPPAQPRAHPRNRSTATNHAESSAGRGRGRGHWLPQHGRVPIRGRRRQEDGTTVVPARRNRAAVTLSQTVPQRQNRKQSERQRRIVTNHMYDTMRSLLPQPATTRRSHRSTVLLEMTVYILRLRNELAMLEGRRKQRERSADLHNTLPPNHENSNMVVDMTNGVSFVDHTAADASALTAVSTLPAIRSEESCLAGTNVAIHVVCGHNCFVTVSCPHSRSDGLLDRVLLTLTGHHVEVLHATVVARDDTKVYTLHCQASQNVELLQDNLQVVLQRVVNDFSLSSSN